MQHCVFVLHSACANRVGVQLGMLCMLVEVGRSINITHNFSLGLMHDGDGELKSI